MRYSGMTFPVAGDEERRAERLWAVYSLERLADQATPAVSFALATVAITYVATTLALLLTVAHNEVPLLAQVVLPLAPVGIFTALTQIDATSQARGQYLDDLERELNLLHAYDSSTAPGPDGRVHAPALPAPAFRHLMKPLYRQHGRAGSVRYWPRLLVQPYTLAGLFVVAYSVYVLDVGIGVGAPQIVATLVYIACMVANFRSLVVAKSPMRYKELRSRGDLALYRGTDVTEVPSASGQFSIGDE